MGWDIAIMPSKVVGAGAFQAGCGYGKLAQSSCVITHIRWGLSTLVMEKEELVGSHRSLGTYTQLMVGGARRDQFFSGEATGKVPVSL